MSLYKLAALSEIPYSTLNDTVKHKVDIANISAGITLCHNGIKLEKQTYTKWLHAGVRIRKNKWEWEIFARLGI